MLNGKFQKRNVVWVWLCNDAYSRQLYCVDARICSFTVCQWYNELVYIVLRKQNIREWIFAFNATTIVFSLTAISEIISQIYFVELNKTSYRNDNDKFLFVEFLTEKLWMRVKCLRERQHEPADIRGKRSTPIVYVFFSSANARPIALFYTTFEHSSTGHTIAFDWKGKMLSRDVTEDDES